MHTLSDYDFNLPEQFIARYPTKERSQSRLLMVNKETQHWVDGQFLDLANYLREGDLLVMNNSKVMPARFYGRKISGGRVEFLIERILDPTHAWTHLRASKSPKKEQIIYLDSGDAIKILGREEDFFVIESVGDRSFYDIIAQIGEIPLPLYFRREAEALDKERYQTVYAQDDGSVAAPTAGLHFDKPFLEALSAQGVGLAYVTLHVGAGTFQPVRVHNIKEHRLHYEWVQVPDSVCEAVARTKARGGRIIAVGTTTVRSLETAGKSGILEPFNGDSNLFIYPGYQFKIIDGLLTNFHLPQSSLLMLVAAFAGYDTIMAAYQHAIEAQYRFYSYGDCMLIL
ncbi:MAG: tRNA preQ1(34) S-adenosylmethionine ribosyltransferase-isomerase QueA [Gammaproteobacteria bacterium]|nr:tRNA preQ1(34) S-adenosylmethionine ribosyltransferase-isomerase QueA [Gammaproteobacteria bacterium]